MAQEQEISGIKKSGRGFASMDKERQREISAKGGREAHKNGTAHEFDSAEAREAGRKGGEARHANRLRNAQRHMPLGQPEQQAPLQ